MARTMWLAVALAMPMLAGCLGAADVTRDAPAALWVPCEHPYPCGDEWPEDLQGPFDLLPVEALRVASHDGVGLETYVYRPDVPGDVPLPAVLWSQPYTGGCAFNVLLGWGECVPAADSEFIQEGGYRVNVRTIVESGYAVVVSNVRGTGNSGGCFSFGGMAEQQDQAFLVDWIARQPWSNGRVAMYGHSYHGYTPWMAAIQQPPALKTIVASGIMTDPYTFFHTTQGAPWDSSGTFAAAMTLTVNNVPPVGGGAQHATVEHVGVYPERACPGAVETASGTAKGQFTDFRNEQWWQERRLIERFDQISAAVMVSHGFNDETGHAVQDDIVWNALPNAPKRFVLGQWGHDLPPPEPLLAQAPFGGDWYGDVLIPWFDFWLKGIGSPDRLGTVTYQVQDETWRETTSWPPAEVVEEVLHLTPDGLVPQEGAGSTSFVAAGPPRDPDCLPVTAAPLGDGATRAVFATAPLEAPATLAGNPFAFLKITSNLPGGIVSLDLFAVRDGGGCDDVQWITGGAADLRFHEGNFQGRDFPVDVPTHVRIDLPNDAWTFAEGERVLVVLSGTGYWANIGQPYTPQITVHADKSQIVLPVVEGTSGGAAPMADYPPRPFVPDWVQEAAV